MIPATHQGAPATRHLLNLCISSQELRNAQSETGQLKEAGSPRHVGVVSVGFLGDCKNHMFFFSKLKIQQLRSEKNRVFLLNV